MRLFPVLALALLPVAARAAHVHAIEGPVLHPEEGFLLGNGDLSCSAYNTADEIVFRLGKGDVWDRRLVYEGSPRPATIREFTDGVLKEGWKSNPFDGRKTEATNGSANAKRLKELCCGAGPLSTEWPYPCPKPTGELKLHLPSDQPGPMRIAYRLFIEEARLEVRAEWKSGIAVALEAVIPPDENTLAVSWNVENWTAETYLGLNDQLPVWWVMHRWKDPDFPAWAATYTAESLHNHFEQIALRNPKITPLPPPTSFADGRAGCIEQKFYPDLSFPDGFAYRLSLFLAGRPASPMDRHNLTGGAWVEALPLKSVRGEIALKVTTSRDAALKTTPPKAYADYRRQADGDGLLGKRFRLRPHGRMGRRRGGRRRGADRARQDRTDYLQDKGRRVLPADGPERKMTMKSLAFGAAAAALLLALPSGASTLAERISADHKILKQDRFYGFERTTFEFRGCEAWIVEPMVPAAKGTPWTWTMQWATAFVPRTPVPQLLREGWHHVTVDVYKTRMNDEGVEIAAAFQDYLVKKLGFNARACLIGMSWGGFFSGRYAAAHPASVAAIYFDAPLLSFRGFHDKEPEDSKRTLGEWWAASAPADWSKDPRMPVNMAGKLAGIPIYVVYGGADRVVPPALNCEAFLPRFKAAGGKIDVQKRAAYAHHPHGLEIDDPTLARFFQRAVAK